MQPNPPMPILFTKGDKVEVRKCNPNPNGAFIWYPATFLRSSPQQQQLYLQFDTLTEFGQPSSPLHRDYVSAEDVRPAPSPDLHTYFKAGDIVEAFCRDNKGWRRATVIHVLENSTYAVSFDFDAQSFLAEKEQWELRTIRDWIDCSWHPPFQFQHLPQPQNKPSESRVTSRGLILRIKCGGNTPVTKFKGGMLVEVKSDEEGFRGSWFAGVIVSFLGNNKFMVEYRTLRTEDKTEFLKEEVDISCIRHCPPSVERVTPFDYLEKVDAWYNDGWWEGYIAQVFNDCKYMVHFLHTNEEMVFKHGKLRPHQEWIDGKWFAASKVNLSDIDLKSNKVKLKRKCCWKASEPLFRDGMMVEVRSDEEGYQGSWYTAVILCSLSCDNYLVEYQTLKTEDESELLRKKAFTSYIRPCPPKIVRINRFKLSEEVDAWYNEGWWVGLVSKILDDLKYAVYFWTTNEELIFEHFSLRPHQEWVDGKWIIAFEKLKVPVKNKFRKYQGEHDGNGVKPNFKNGTKVRKLKLRVGDRKK